MNPYGADDLMINYSMVEHNCSELEAYHYQDPNIFFIRFVLVVGIGSSMALVGIAANSLLVCILRSAEFRRTNAIFLLVIALLDLTTQLNYLALIVAIFTAEYFEAYWLYRLWHNYAIVLFTLGQVTPIAQTYLILAASVDRYLTGRSEGDRNGNFDNLNCSQNFRYATIIMALIAAVLLKGIALWETERDYTGCPGFAQVTLVPSESFPLDRPSYRWFKLWILPVVQLYVPFLLLLIVNCLIVYQLHKVSEALLSGDFINADLTRRRYGLTPTPECLDYIQIAPMTAVLQKMPFLRKTSSDFKRKKKELRGATVMMIIMVTSYLVSNVLNVLISFMEQLWGTEYLQNNFLLFYTFASDVSSILVVISSGIRLPVYYVCNRTIREAVWIKFASERSEAIRNSTA